MLGRTGSESAAKGPDTETSPMPRIFTGIEIPESTGFMLSLKRGGLHGARWINPENYHITLRFIGDVDHSTAHEVTRMLERFSDGPPLMLRLTHLGVFGGDKPRSLYAGVEMTEELQRLQASQERLLQRIGLKPEGRKFSPHVTLARLKGVMPGEIADYFAQTMRFEPITFTVGRFVLFSSRDSVGGGPYVIEQAYPLAA
jgi:2'-5' RNA ligase